MQDWLITSGHAVFELHPHWVLWQTDTGDDVRLRGPQEEVVLNEQAAFLLTQCNGQQNLDQVLSQFRSHFPCAPDPERSALDFLRKAHDAEWLLIRSEQHCN